MPNRLLAQDLNLENIDSSLNRLTTPTATSILGAIINLLLIFGSLIAFFLLLWGGLRWIISAGDKDKLSSAKKTISYAVIGLIMLFSIFSGLYLLGNLFGVNLLCISIPTPAGDINTCPTISSPVPGPCGGPSQPCCTTGSPCFLPSFSCNLYGVCENVPASSPTPTHCNPPGYSCFNNWECCTGFCDNGNGLCG